MIDLTSCINVGMICLTIITVYALSVVKARYDNNKDLTKNENLSGQGGARLIGNCPPHPPKGGSNIHDK